MVGPVFFLELLLGSRRGRLNTFRWVIAGWLVLQFALFFSILCQAEAEAAPAEEMSQFINYYFQIFVAQHFILLLLATPVFVAGAITDEKASGTLQYLLTADLTSWEIVIGKFLGRMAQVALFGLVGWPLICFASGYGHLGMTAFLCTTLVLVLIFFALGAASIWASLRSKQTREAVLFIYLWIGTGALCIWGILAGIEATVWNFKPNSPVHLTLLRVSGVLSCLNPVHVLEPVWSRNDLHEFAGRLKITALFYGSVGALCLGWSVWRFRRTYLRQLETAGRPRKSRWTRATRAVDDEPIRWRERTAGRSLARWLWMGLIALLSAGSSAAIVYQDEPMLFLAQGFAVLVLASMVVGIRASGAVTGERERQTWDSLLLTPLETWEIIYDKVMGALDTLYPYLLAFGLPAVGLSFKAGPSAVTYTLSMLWLTWASMYYMGATGIWCSVRSGSSWRSLVTTLATGYGYGFVVLTLFALAYLWAGLVIGPVIAFFLLMIGIKDLTLGVVITTCIVSCVGLSWFLWRASDTKIAYARAWVETNERYGRTFVRSLSSALRKHYQRLEEQEREKKELVEQPEPVPPAAAASQ
jgi:ABC-type transport system involved in multi-copper enzyme maturation permease subunit